MAVSAKSTTVLFGDGGTHVGSIDRGAMDILYEKSGNY